MKSVGSLYVDTIKLKHPVRPLFEWGWSQETEEPYRESAVCIVFWVPFAPRGYAFGIWGKPVHEDVALQKAVKAFDKAPKPEEIKTWQKVGELEDF
ncbi:hypothetical protein UFOVP225_41 [uncultured Caudovirales phage]|uniref:Uncharacterized protein n=1 Tax=uncultured Caudovirales phage TaxID=2100421 RepID=A0A6J5L1Q2_9CAUD|nr:hypothetical protein UFOVP113_54 [uncultured Caudovirales phage]CAB5219227.1 hypothetical protein UFOVP225_41 [uncultured Caudovirales phage]